jgi:hypothetical protein
MYLSNVDEQVKRARAYLEQMASFDLARSLRREPEAEDQADWSALREALEAFVAVPATTWEGGSFQASVAAYETLGLLWVEFHGSRAHQRIAELKRRERAELEAVTYEVQTWRGDRFAPAHRVARTTVDEWFSRAGHQVIGKPYQPEARGSFDASPGDGHPTGGYSVKTIVIGVELPEGTVRSKRLVVRDGKRVIEYLVKARGQRAEAKYQRGQRIAELRSQLDNVDMLSPEKIKAIHAELKELGA